MTPVMMLKMIAAATVLPSRQLVGREMTSFFAQRFSQKLLP
jgi:hypothetical protein